MTAEPAGTISAVVDVLDIDICDPIPALAGTSSGAAAQAWVLCRVGGVPFAVLDAAVGVDGLDSHTVAAAIDRAGHDVLVAIGAVEPGVTLTDAGVGPVTTRIHAQREAAMADGPRVCVVVCTRDNPEQLTRALDSLEHQSYPRCDVLVVDNAPSTPATHDLVRERMSRTPTLQYLLAEEPGLSNARNRALAHLEADGGIDVVAWLDDDETADSNWVAELASAFVAHPHAQAVSGMVAPAELVTRAQVHFEQFGGHSKGRGFAVEVFGPGMDQHPLLPAPPFGVGANMAFRVGALSRYGGFDPHLGAGTPAGGNEDTLAFTQLLLDGAETIYHPYALTWHYHRRDRAALERQLTSYGTGLGAFYAAVVWRQPWRLATLAALAPRALSQFRNPDRVSGVDPDFPTAALDGQRRGLLRGPLVYARSRLHHLTPHGRRARRTGGVDARSHQWTR
jgi:glycosyltransferase involved in cell wall biosynthesis